MTWCDKLASTPAIGLRYESNFVASEQLLHALSPLLNEWVRGEKPTFTLESQDSFGFTFTTEDGFHYGLDPQRLYVEFRHRLKTKHVSGGPPVVEMISKPLPYTQLMKEVKKRLLHAADLLASAKPYKIARIGYISATRVSLNDAPPGIRRLLEYFGRPWQDKLEEFNVTIGAQIASEANWTERCVHSIARGADPEDPLLSLKFDWQRKFSSIRTVTNSSLRELVDDAEVKAMRYFEELGQGDRFDEDILRITT